MSVGEKEPDGTVHRENGAEQNRRGGNRNDPGPDSKDQRDAAKHFRSDNDIGELGRQSDAAEKLRRSGRREDEQFEAGMREEEHAQADAQQQRGIGSGSGIDHGCLLIYFEIYMIYSPEADNLVFWKYRSHPKSEIRHVGPP